MIPEALKGIITDESGTAMVEYTILLGIISATILIAIAAISSFIATRWMEIGAALP